MTHSWQTERIDPNQKPLRVGAIGCGSHATTAIWPQFPNAGLVLEAVCARNFDRAATAARRFGVGRAFDNAERMLDEVELDALVVVVPPPAFAEYVSLAIDHRIPAFVEKPGADSASEASELAARSEEAGVPVMVGYQKRFAAAYRRAKKLTEANEFGPLTLGSFTWAMGPFHQRFSLREWLFENPVHHFDLARFFLGEIGNVEARAVESRGEFVLTVIGTSTSGGLLSIQATTTASWDQHNEAVRLFGAGHSVTVDNVDTCVYRPPESPELTWRPNYTVPALGNFSGETLGYGAELDHFRAVVAGRAQPESDLASAAATLRLAAEVGALAERAVG